MSAGVKFCIIYCAVNSDAISNGAILKCRRAATCSRESLAHFPKRGLNKAICVQLPRSIIIHELSRVYKLLPDRSHFISYQEAYSDKSGVSCRFICRPSFRAQTK